VCGTSSRSCVRELDCVEKFLIIICRLFFKKKDGVIRPFNEKKRSEPFVILSFFLVLFFLHSKKNLLDPSTL